MPGPVSESYEPPICACGRFKRVHDWPEGTITAEPGVDACDGYREVALESTDLGKALEDFVGSKPLEAKEKTCPQHGDYPNLRKCPACRWAEKYPDLVNFKTGCPRCGKPLDGNGFLMWCSDGTCPMQTTSHAAIL